MMTAQEAAEHNRRHWGRTDIPLHDACLRRYEGKHGVPCHHCAVALLDDTDCACQ